MFVTFTVYKIILDFILDFPSFHNCFLRYEFKSTIFEVCDAIFKLYLKFYF